MRNIESLAIDLSLHDTKERLLNLLLKNINMIEKRDVSILDNLSHTKIANLTGTVRHIIDRHFKSLKKRGHNRYRKEKNRVKKCKKSFRSINFLLIYHN